MGKLLLAAASIFAGLMSQVCAVADITITSTVSVAGLQADPNGPVAPAFPLTFTTYFQGPLSRIECSDGKVYIFDNSKGLVYQLDTKHDTFRTTTMKALKNFKLTLPKGGPQDISIDSDLNTGESIETAKYLLTTATDVPLAGYAHISLAAPGGFGGDERGSGGRPRSGQGGGGSGGSEPAGGTPGMPFGYGGPPNGPGGIWHGRFQIPSFELRGDLWTSPSYTMPRDRRLTALPIAIELLWGASPLIGEMADTLDGLRQIPLHSVIHVKQTFSGPGGDESAEAPVNTVTTTFDIQSVTSDTVPQTLFTIPEGYTSDTTPVQFPEMAAPINPNQAISNDGP